MFVQYFVVFASGAGGDSTAANASTAIGNFLGQGWKFVSLSAGDGGVYITFGR
jgi:hypothetical protein